MQQTELNFFDDVEVDWKAIAELLARQILKGTGLYQSIEEFDARKKREKDDYHVAAALLGKLRSQYASEDPWAYSDWSAAQAVGRVIRRREAEQRSDPVRRVLISPRLGQSHIERIVETQNGRVRVEFLLDGSWRRTGGDLRTVLSAAPLPARISGALSRTKGEFDGLPTEECLARLRMMDSQVTIGEAKASAAESAMHSHLTSATLREMGGRITEEELLHDSFADDTRFTGSDVTNAAIAAEMLRTTRAIWRSVTLDVEAPEDGPFVLSVFGNHNPKDRVKPSALLRTLVARRYEAAEAHQQRAWKKLTFVVSSVELPEWSWNVNYGYDAPTAR